MSAFLPQHKDFFRELLNDSDSEGDFEGFDSSDDDKQPPENNNGDFLMENCLGTKNTFTLLYIFFFTP